MGIEDLFGTDHGAGFTNSASTSQFGSLTTSELMKQMAKAVAKFKKLRRAELRGWSEAIEKVGACPTCGHKVTLRSSGCGDALVMCDRIYAAIRRQVPKVERVVPPGTLGGMWLETFP